RILSWSDDDTLRLWDGTTGAALLTMRHDGAVNGAQMLHDGRILSWSDDHKIRLWTIDFSSLRAIAASLFVAPLTNEERAAYFLPTLPPPPSPPSPPSPPILEPLILTPSHTPALALTGTQATT